MDIEKYVEKRKTTTYVAEKNGCNVDTAIKWASKNGVDFIGRMYYWTEEDIAKFENRPKKGRPKKKT